MIGKSRWASVRMSRWALCNTVCRFAPTVPSAVLLTTGVLLAGCSATEEKSISDADWIADHELYEGDETSLFVESEFRNKKKKGDDEEEPTKEDFVRSADTAWNSGDPEKALFDYLRALKLDNSDETIYFKIGLIQEYGGNVDLAGQAYAKAIELKPTYVPAMERRGTMLLKQRKYAEAKSTFREAIALDKVRLAKLSHESADKPAREVVHDAGPSSAATAQGAAIQSATADSQSTGMLADPALFDSSSPLHAYNGLGVIEDLAGNHQAALRAFDIARKISPGSAFIYNNMGYSSYLADDLELAERLFRKAVTLDRGYIAASRNLALVHVRRGQYQQAIDILSASVDDKASAYNTVGYLCMLDKKYDLAKKFYNEAIETSPTYFAAANQNLKKNRELRSRTIAANDLP
jgi:tetratricopeptide (TPR) repeat protein